MNQFYNGNYEPFFYIKTPLYLEYVDIIEDEVVVLNMTEQGRRLTLTEVVEDLKDFIKSEGTLNINCIAIKDTYKSCREDLKRTLKTELEEKFPKLTIYII